ncbi:MAG: TIM barrel protein [Gemmatales bacterium]
MNHPTHHRRQFLAASAGGLAALPTIAHAAPVVSHHAASFKLGMVTYNIGAEWDVPTILKVCKETGLAAVELRTTHKHGVEPSLTPDQRREVKHRFADAGITLWGLGTVCEFHSPDQSVVQKNIETCKAFLELSHDLGGRGVKVRPNGIPKNVPEEKILRQIGESLIPCGKEAANLGLEVWVEVHGSGSNHPPRMKTMMETANLPNVGVTWNSNKEDIKDGSVRTYFELLKPWIKSCHINSIYGSYPYRELFTCFKEMKYDRVTLIEIPEKLDPVNGTLLLKYYKRLWQELVGS